MSSIAGGLSPLAPTLAAVTAGKLLLKEINRLARDQADFAFESTLSGLAYATRIKDWKSNGYRMKSTSFGCHHRPSRCGALPRALSREDTTYRGPSCCADLTAGGKTLKIFIEL